MVIVKVDSGLTDNADNDTADLDGRHTDSSAVDEQGEVGPDKPTTPPKGGGGGGLERVTVNLIPRSSRALERAVELTADSKTVVINRALQLYAYLEETWSDGGEVVIKDRSGREKILKVF